MIDLVEVKDDISMYLCSIDFWRIFLYSIHA